MDKFFNVGSDEQNFQIFELAKLIAESINMPSIMNGMARLIIEVIR